jgi:UDP-GlcNAc:undecaprenyl-phosphate/decaprenyl-phosphate GlcNAc-1-phosphate transferase
LLAAARNSTLLDDVRLIGVFAASVACALAASPLAARVAHRIRFYDHPVGLSYKIHVAPTPYLGGAAVLAAVAVGTLTFSSEPLHFTLVFAVAIVLWIIGTLDDSRPIHPIARVLLEAGAGVPLWLSGSGWNLFPGGGIDLLFTCAWIVAIVNSFNVIDNMDGVAATLAAVTGAGTSVLALVSGDYGLAALAAALCGACMGFLPYNVSSPARIFLGDGGTMPVGFIMAVVVMGLPMNKPLGWSVLLPATLLVGVPCFNTVLVTVSRSRRGIPFWIGGTDSLTHRLRRQLGSEHAVALFLGIAQATLCGLAAGLIEIPIVGLGSVLATVGCAALGLTLLAVLETPAWATPSPARPAATLTR